MLCTNTLPYFLLVHVVLEKHIQEVAVFDSFLTAVAKILSAVMDICLIQSNIPVLFFEHLFNFVMHYFSFASI